MILKLNSRGLEVKELQEFLEIGADGIFGKGTESTVKTWQSSNGLDADGIVGPATWDSMGLATTDTSEKTYTTDNGLVINQHFLPKGEYKNGPINAEYAFIHHTAGWHNPYNVIDSWGRDTRGAVATEFVLGGSSVKGNDDTYDGLMVQAFPEGNYGWYLGKVAESEIVTLAKPFRGYTDWHRYSDAQIESLRLWILFIGERDNINIKAGLPSLVKDLGAGAFEFNEDAYYGKVKGLWTHTNTRKDKSDMFPQPELLDMLVSL